MKRFIITGPSKAVNGIVNISGAKNSCLPLMAASILFKKEVILRNVPLVQDVLTMKDLLPINLIFAPELFRNLIRSVTSGSKDIFFKT